MKKLGIIVLCFLILASFYSLSNPSITGMAIANLSGINETVINETTNTSFGSFNMIDEDFDGAIIINASDLTLDCNGSTIYGNESGYGIAVDGNRNIIIQNCNIRDYGTGIFANNTENLTILNCTIYSDLYGIRFFNTTLSNITLSNISSNSYGIYLQNQSTVSMVHNLLSNTYSIVNNQSQSVSAEYNYWNRITNSSIQSAILDASDSAAYGLVDIAPWLVWPFNISSLCNLYLSSSEMIIQDEDFVCSGITLNFTNTYIRNSSFTLNRSVVKDTIYVEGNSSCVFANVTFQNASYLKGTSLTMLITSNLSTVYLYNNPTLNSTALSYIKQIKDVGASGVSSNITLDGLLNITNTSVDMFYPNTLFRRSFPAYVFNLSNPYQGTVKLKPSDLSDDLWVGSSDVNGYLLFSYTFNSSTYSTILNLTVDNRTIAEVRMLKATPLNSTFDHVPPTVLAYSPANLSLSNALNTSISITFSEPLLESSLNDSTIKISGKTNVTGYVRYNRTLNLTVFDPYVLLAQNSNYQVNVTVYVKDASGNPLSSFFVFNFSTAYSDIDNDGTPDYLDADSDGDGIIDGSDVMIGNSSSINTNIANLNVTVNGSSNLSQSFNTTYDVRIYGGTDLLVTFRWNFANNNTLRLYNITILRNEIDGKGSIAVSNLLVSKSVMVDRSNSSYNGLCVKDRSSIESARQISPNCTGQYETWVKCDSSSGFTCKAIGSRYNLSYLSSSAAVQMNDLAVPTISSPGPSGTDYDGTVTLTVTTSENSICRYATSDHDYFAMSSTFSSTGGLIHQQVISGLMNGAYTYYVKCIDESGNDMESSQVIAFSVGLRPTIWAEDGGSGAVAARKAIALPPRQTFAYNIIDPSNPILININELDMAFHRAIITINRMLINVKITFQNEITKPKELPDAPGVVFQYLSIKTINLKESDIGGITLQFKVPLLWKKDMSISDVSILKYDGSGWKKLVIKKVGQDIVNEYYEAKLDSFSYFAVTGYSEELPEPIPPPKEPEVSNVTSNLTFPLAEEPSVQPPVGGENVTVEQPKGGISFRFQPLTTTLLVFVLFMIGFSIFIYIRGRPEEETGAAKGALKEESKAVELKAEVKPEDKK